MSKQIHPAKLGIFVLVAVALGLGTLAVLSSGNLFKKTLDYVMIFDGDARGLKTGAPVLLKGVAVGQVTNIQLVVDTTKKKSFVPVTVKLDPSLLVYIGDLNPEESVIKAIEEGMRAQLQTQSFVTGMLEVSLVLLPGTEAIYHGEDYDLPEIPTVPPLTKMLANEVKDLNLKEMLDDLKDTLKGVQIMTRDIQEEKLLGNLGQTLEGLNTITQVLNKDLPLLSEDLLKTSASIRELSDQGRQVLLRADNMMADLEKSTPGLLKGAQDNTDKLMVLQTVLTETLKEAEGMLSSESPLRFHIAALLSRYTKVAAKLEVLLDTMETNPESILTGKPE